MRKLTLEPDPWMRWLYDHQDPRYLTDEAKYLRERRAAAIRSAPEWMLAQAAMNTREAEKGELVCNRKY